MKLYSFTTEALEQQTRVIKNLLLNFMLSKEMIDEKLYNDLENNYAIIIRKPTFFGNIWKRILVRADHVHYIIVKQQNLTRLEGKDKPKKEDKTLKIVKPNKNKDEE